LFQSDVSQAARPTTNTIVTEEMGEHGIARRPDESERLFNRLKTAGNRPVKRKSVKVFLPLQEFYATANLEKDHSQKNPKILFKKVIESALHQKICGPHCVSYFIQNHAFSTK